MKAVQKYVNAIASERGPDRCSVPPAQGFHEAVPFDRYLSWPCMSKSEATAVDASPAEWKRRQEVPFEPTAEMHIGSAGDAGWIEDRLDAEFMMRSDLKSRRSKSYTEAVAAAGDRTVLVGDECDRVMGIIGALSRHELASALREKLQRQLSAVWVDPETGLPCKCRYDLAGTVDDELATLLERYLAPEVPPLFPGDDLIVDLKTTFDNRPDVFRKQMSNLRYHWQAGHYSSGWEVITGHRASWLWLTVKSKPTHSVEVYHMPDHATELGRVQMGRVMSTFKACLDAGTFPASSNRVTTLDLPPWAYREDM